jgi:hypothetical protein
MDWQISRIPDFEQYLKLEFSVYGCFGASFVAVL